MGKVKTIVSGVAWTVTNNAVSIVYGIISVPFLINYFGKEEYGLIGIALSVNVYIHLLDLGMTNSNVRFFSEYLAKKDHTSLQKLFNLTHLFYLVVGIINTVVLFVLSCFVEELFKVTPAQAIVLRNLLWVLALNATFSRVSACFDQLLTAKELLSWIKRRSTMLKLSQFLILWITIAFKFSIESYFFGYIFIGTIILPLTISKAKKVLPNLKLGCGFDKAMFWIVFPYAFSVFSFSIFQFCTFNFRPLFLGSFSGPSAVAEYSIMNTIATVVTMLSGSFMQVLLPIITKMKVNSEDDNILRIMNDGTRYVTMLLSMVIFSMILSMNELITLYVGSEYASLTKWVVIWLATLLLSHRNVMTSLVFTEKKIRSVAVMGALAMTIAVSLYILLIPKYGVGGVVIGFLAHELAHTLFYYVYFLPKKFRINTWLIFRNSVLPIWVVAIIALLLSYQVSLCIHIHSCGIIILKTLLFFILFIVMGYKWVIRILSFVTVKNHR